MSEEVKNMAELKTQGIAEKQEVATTMPQPVPTFQQQKEPTLYDTHVKENFHIFGIASLIYACLYVFCMYKNDAGITYLLLVFGSLALIKFCFNKLGINWKRESVFYVVSMILLAVSTFCTDDGRIIFFNKLGVFLLTISLLLGMLYDTKQWNLGKYLASIGKVCVMAVGELARPFSDAVWYCKNKLNKKNSKYLYLLIGIGITIPLFIVVFLLLSSADAVFRNLADHLLSGISFWDIYMIVLMIAFMFFSTYCILTYLCKNEIKEAVEDSRKWEPLIAIPVASVLTLLYLVFSGIQIVYLFMGNMQLPEGYTYAEYAREGFFQLLAVSILNLIMVLIGLYFFKTNKLLKVVLIIMSLCTFVMIASSALRMVIYIQYYYLTFLRILVLWSLLVLFLLFAGVVVYIIKEDFPLFRYSMVVVTCLYIALSFSHPDYWIAKVNLESAQETRSEFFKGEPYRDYSYLGNLNADAASVMVEWIEGNGYILDCYYTEGMTYGEYSLYAEDRVYVEGEGWIETTDQVDQKEWCAYMYLSNLKEDCKEIGIRRFNVSRFLADFEVLYQSTKGM